MTAALAAGVDAGKRYLDFGIEPSRKHFRVANAAAGIEDAITRLRGAGVRKVVLEAIGPFAHAAVKRLVAEGFEVGWSIPVGLRHSPGRAGNRARQTGWTHA